MRLVMLWHRVFHGPGSIAWAGGRRWQCRKCAAHGEVPWAQTQTPRLDNPGARLAADPAELTGLERRLKRIDGQAA